LVEGASVRGRPTSGRDDILAAIRAARPLAESPPVPVPPYRHSLDLPAAALADRLAERLAEYGVTVTRASSLAAISGIAATLFRRHGRARILVPPDLPAAWRPAGVMDDTGLSAEQLDEADGAMTGCRLAIAETGTILLDGHGISGRRALTLLPDYHLCVVTADQIVGLLPEAMAVLAAAVTQGPVTLFSGPSATADIELDRVQGVHGPRTLDVILIMQ
jgi:L-lactate dehydrogenase complex protein LldG